MATAVKKFIRPDFHVVAFDETRDWAIRPQDVPFIESIQTIQFFDSNEVTYCCEVTPSYALNFLQYQVRLTAAGEELDEFAKDEIQQHYELTRPDEEVEYHHCHRIDAIIARRKAANSSDYRHYGDPNPKLKVKEYREWLEDNDLIDEVREDLQSNSVI